MLARLSQKFARLGKLRRTRRIDRQIKAIKGLQSEMQALSDEALREGFQSLAPRFEDGVEVDCLPRAFAYIKEAIARARGLQAYDVQLRAGLVLAAGHIAEMATGEGKTLVAVFPASVFALSGRGVHLATVNAYLARRDFETMRPIYEKLGFTVALLPDKAGPNEKRPAYQADITYGTGYEFGFDFLRDQMVRLQAEKQPLGSEFRQRIFSSGGLQPVSGKLMQRELAYAIIDEIDSVLIDEAVTPLVLSKGLAPGENPASAAYNAADTLAKSLEEDVHYLIDAKLKKIKITQEGLELIYKSRPNDQLGLMKRGWHEYVEQALRARLFYHRDIQYLVRNDAVELIDENTGRSFAERKWQGGLHQAVEAKESVMISHETESDVTISRQRFYQLYPTVCGMTGTASEAASELSTTYSVPVDVIPRNRPLRTDGLRARIFADRGAKHRAIVDTVSALRDSGRPVLIGTRNVRQSESLAELLGEAGITPVVLNARQDAEEAAIIARAGERGNVTLATNMAGRGADIPIDSEVEQLGGLFVVGEERNDSRRVDRQLAGRAGRQGARGSVQFFMSLEDELFERSGTAVDPDLKGELNESYIRAADRLQLRMERATAKVRADLTRQDRTLDRLRRHT